MNAQLLSQTRFDNFIGLLLLAAFALACGGSPSASEDKKDVTFGEYLAVCAASGAIDMEITLKEFATALGEIGERLEAVEPPEEVRDWHNAMLVYQRALKTEPSHAGELMVKAKPPLPRENLPPLAPGETTIVE